MLSAHRERFNTATPPAVLVAWRELLSRVSWDYFLTLTFDPSKHPRSGYESWLSAWRWFLYAWLSRCAMAAGDAWQDPQTGRIRGPWANAYRKGRGQPMWVLALEPHQDGRLHAHVLLKLTRYLPYLDYRIGQDLWRKGCDGRPGRGICWFEVPRSQAHTAAYVAKYVVKFGSDALTFSPNFDAARMTCCTSAVPG